VFAARQADVAAKYRKNIPMSNGRSKSKISHSSAGDLRSTNAFKDEAVAGALVH
jgi:hypothetical protein